MDTAAEYTQADVEKAATMLARMMPHMMAGMTFEQAGQAVLMRDNELFAVIKGRTEEGAMIRQELATQVYSQIRK